MPILWCVLRNLGQIDMSFPLSHVLSTELTVAIPDWGEEEMAAIMQPAGLSVLLSW